MRQIRASKSIVFLLAGLISAMGLEALAAPAEIRACQRCHGPNGISVNAQVPNLAGQNAHYIAKQIRAFQEGRRFKPKSTLADDLTLPDRRHQVMGRMTASLDDDAIKAVSEYYASQVCRVAQVPKDRQLDNRCTDCHGRSGKSDDPEIPNLAGQNLPYMLNQLRAFRRAADGIDPTQEKNWRRHPEMEDVIGELTKKELQSLRYFAGLGCR